MWCPAPKRAPRKWMLVEGRGASARTDLRLRSSFTPWRRRHEPRMELENELPDARRTASYNSSTHVTASCPTSATGTTNSRGRSERPASLWRHGCGNSGLPYMEAEGVTDVVEGEAEYGLLANDEEQATVRAERR